MKKLFLLVLFSLTGIFLFAGGEKDQTQSGSTSYDSSKILEITWLGLNQMGILPREGSAIQRELEKRYNIKIKNVPVDSYNVEQMNLLLATGVEFDIWSWGIKDVISAVETGTIRPLPLEMVKEHAPEFYKLYEETSPNWKYIGSHEGVLYGLPRVSDTFRSPVGLSVRTDWMKKVGITQIPKTLAELKEMLIRFRENDPDGNGRKDTYGLSIGGNGTLIAYLNPYLMGAYGVNMARWGVDTDGSPKAWAVQPEYRAALEELSDWWAKGIYDPQVPLLNRVQQWERFGAGITGGYFGTEWMLEPSRPGVGWSNLLKERPDLDPDTVFTHIPPVSGPKGASTLAYDVTLTSNAYYFGRNTSDEKLVRLLTLLNETLADPKLYVMATFGVEGVHFDLDSKGHVMIKPEWSTPEKYTELGYMRFLNNQFCPPEYVKYNYDSIRYRAWERIINYPVLPIHLVNGIQTSEDREYKSGVDTITQEYFYKVVTGEWKTSDTWDNYVSRVLNAGLQKQIDAKKRVAQEISKY
ncbi:extracellular solute-binding protein [Treponema sp. OttesenSCG-928-L16]|nr:extracellular solute-binding protein [Treponema sp. OttesenSCG-928-L16]